MIAVATRPGLVGALVVGLTAAKNAEGDWQLRLRQITGTAADHARLVAGAVKQANHSADRIPVGLGPLQLEANAAIAISDVGAEQVGITAVGGNENVEVAVAIEIGARESTGDLGDAKAAPTCDVTSWNRPWPSLRNSWGGCA